MAKYRKKPVIIEAEQWFPGRAIPNVCQSRCWASEGIGGPHVHTAEGPLHVSPGDWIITGIQQEKYPCKPDIFAATYEPVEDCCNG